MKRFFGLLAVGFLAASIIPAAAQSGALEKKKLVISVGGSISQMNKVAYVVAVQKKFFQEEGLEVESVPFASGTAGLQALIGGNSDVSEGSFEHTLRMQAKGIHITCIATFGRYPANVLVVTKPNFDKIKTVKDLKGKKIGVSAPGASTHNFVASLMERAGVPWKEASYISIGTGPSAVAAVRSGGELDALVNLDPAISALGSRAAFGGDYLADCLFAKTDFVKANPNTTQAVANAIVHAMQWLKTASVDDIIAVLPPEYYKADEALYRQSLKTNLAAFTWDGIVKTEAVQNVLDAISVLDPSFKTKKFDLAATHDNKLIENALKKYGKPSKS
ncbi:MAG: ABC transporter substrate-binding protein [Rhizobiales bacterium]|nr:ABC transporter substrate-binding protein [Hyphomicrobiales bacterium]